jgi:hypothetical protein
MSAFLCGLTLTAFLVEINDDRRTGWIFALGFCCVLNGAIAIGVF